MPTHNPNNERTKRKYFNLLKEAMRQSEATVDAVAKALARFEAATGYRDFKNFHHGQAMAFKERLAEQDSLVTGEKLSQATRYATLTHLKRFFQWLALEPGYRSRIQYSDAEYFNLSDKESRVAKARRLRSGPTVTEAKQLIGAMPFSSEIEQRNRALVAFTLLTGARDSALASMKLKHVDLEQGCVHQDAREVRTKFSKTFTTYFFPVGREARQIVEEWIAYLREHRLWGDDDPLFPKTEVLVGADKRFAVSGLSRLHWSNSGPIRAIFREASEAARLPYFNPHSFRNTLVRLGEKLCKTAEEFKAWSQNLGHEAVLTTFKSYGAVSPRRQAHIVRSLGDHRKSAMTGKVSEMAKALMRELEVLADPPPGGPEDEAA